MSEVTQDMPKLPGCQPAELFEQRNVAEFNIQIEEQASGNADQAKMWREPLGQITAEADGALVVVEQLYLYG